MVSKAFAMRGENLDHAAFADLTLAAFRQHAAYFGAQQLEARYLALDIGKVRSGNRIRLGAAARRPARVIRGWRPLQNPVRGHGG